MTQPTPLDALTADDLLLDRIAAREAVEHDDQLTVMLLAAARQCDTVLRPHHPSGRRLGRRRTLSALTALGLAASGVGVAAAMEKAQPAVAGRTEHSQVAEARSPIGSASPAALPRPRGPGRAASLIPPWALSVTTGSHGPSPLLVPVSAGTPGCRARCFERRLGTGLGDSASGPRAGQCTRRPAAVRAAPGRPGARCRAPGRRAAGRPAARRRACPRPAPDPGCACRAGSAEGARALRHRVAGRTGRTHGRHRPELPHSAGPAAGAGQDARAGRGAGAGQDAGAGPHVSAGACALRAIRLEPWSLRIWQ